MDENQVRGTARHFSGKIQEEAGRAAGDTQAELKGKANQAAGAAQYLYGQSTEAIRDSTSDLDAWLRNRIQTQPYTAALIVFAAGWLLGRMRQPY